MAADNDQSRQIENLEQQIEKLTREFDGMMAAYASGRRTRLLVFLVAVVFVCGVAYVFYRSGKELTTDEYREKLTAAAQKQMEVNKERYWQQVEIFVKNSTPVVTEAFNRQATKDMPKFAKLLGQEQDKFTSEIEEQFRQILKKRYDETLTKHEQILRQQFPKANDAEIESMMANTKVALDEVLEKNYINELKKQIQEFFDTWHEFPAASAPVKGEHSLPEQFRDELMTLIMIKFANKNPQPLAPIANPPKKPGTDDATKKPSDDKKPAEEKKPSEEKESKK